MNAPRDLDWSTVNQHVLVLEFVRLGALLADGQTEVDAAARAQAEADALRARLRRPAAIDTLARLFGLTPFERDIVLLCAGCEMDARLADCCAHTQGQASRTGPSFGLALAALPNPHWSALAPQGTLRQWQLISVDDSTGLTRGRLRLAENVLHYLAGLAGLDSRLAPLLAPVFSTDLMCPAHSVLLDRLVALQQTDGCARRPIVLYGDDPDGQQDVAAALGARLGLQVFRLRSADLPASAAEQDALARRWQRDAALLGAGLLITHTGNEAAVIERFVHRLEGVGGWVCVAGHSPGLADAEAFVVNRPDAPAQCLLWREALGAARATAVQSTDFNALVSHYRLSARRIAALAGQSTGNLAEPLVTQLHNACRSHANAMGVLAQPIEAHASWHDLVLPEAQRHTLRQIETHIRHRLTVHHDWGFAGSGPRGLGIATLFWGDSGTGKTMAAEVLANSLDLALFRIDLSAVVSKYIGETEKNLRQVFDAAEESGAILLFDEADALFGKRSEVKDSHDRYANIEVSYLLQRMEAYRGLAILTTNHKAALDTAFARRLRFVVHFPFPDERQREALWRSVFPSATPLDTLDYAKLARLVVPGGSIRNIALAAAFLAAEAGTPVSMAHLLHAAHVEAAKRDKPMSDAETRGWV